LCKAFCTSSPILHKLRGVITLYPGGYRPLAPVEISLGDYYDLSNGVWRISQ